MFLKRIWQLLEGDRSLLGWSIFFGLTFTGLSIIPPLLVRKMVQWLQQPELAGSFYLLGFAVAGIYVLRGITRYVYGMLSHVAAYRTLHRLMNRVYRHLQTMSPGYMNQKHSGNLVARTVGDVEAIEDFIAHGIPETMLALVIPVTLSVVLFLLNWQLAIIALIPIPVVAVVVYIIKTRTRNHWMGVRKKFADLAANIQDHLSGLTVIQSFNQEAELAKRVEQESLAYRDNIIYANKWSLVPAGVVETASGAGLVLIVISGSWMIRGQGTVELADLVVFLMYLNQIFVPFLRLASLTENLQKSTASAERVFELLDTPPLIVDSADAQIPKNQTFDLEFANVNFEYQPDLPVLKDVSFRIEAGETVALAGETGVGKTTVCHLLLRYFDSISGTISLGGHDIQSLPLAYLRSQTAFVSQDVFLFHGTIRDNLLLGNLNATEAELEQAVRAANAYEFIQSFPDGYETLVGERGVRLSGGQKQRLAIARALLKDAPILILDEATSAVDNETENQIKEAIMRATEGRTVLIVAHRLSTIMAADRIVVLEKGQVVETGTYEQLQAAEGSFARICRLQEDVLW